MLPKALWKAKEEDKNRKKKKRSLVWEEEQASYAENFDVPSSFVEAVGKNKHLSQKTERAKLQTPIYELDKNTPLV